MKGIGLVAVGVLWAFAFAILVSNLVIVLGHMSQPIAQAATCDDMIHNFAFYNGTFRVFENDTITAHHYTIRNDGSSFYEGWTAGTVATLGTAALLVTVTVMLGSGPGKDMLKGFFEIITWLVSIGGIAISCEAILALWGVGYCSNGLAYQTLLTSAYVELAVYIVIAIIPLLWLAGHRMGMF